jgi:methylglutaconyl-CoA hydratase
MTQGEPVRLERHGAVAVLFIDRPERKNSLSRGTLLAFGRLGQQLSADRGLRAIIVTGVGSQVFCAGADLKERREMNGDAVREWLGLCRSELGWLDHSRVPAVAAINGVALGGGLELALMCDLRVAAEHAELGLPETGLGIIPGAGGTQRLPRLIGEARAKELILLGRRIGTAEAYRIGLVNRVTPAGKSVVQDTLEWIAPIVQGAPLAQAAALAAIDASFGVPLLHGLELERVYYDRCLRSADRNEALTALAQKRKPIFRGE